MPATARVPAPKTEGAPAKISHYVLRTSRRAEMHAWYLNVLGAETMFESDRISFLTYDDEHHRIAFLAHEGLRDADMGAAGLDHVAFSYHRIGELIAAYERLKGQGIMPVWQVNHGPTTSLYYRDPDGNKVELQVDNFATVADLNAWFATGAFNRNARGIDIDMDDLARRWRAGAPEAELLRPMQT